MNELLDLQPIRERLGKRTQGDWSLKHREDGFTLVVGSSVKENYEALGWSGNIADIRSPHGAGYSMQDLEANAEFIVNAPTDISALLAEVKRLRRSLEIEHAVCNEMSQSVHFARMRVERLREALGKIANWNAIEIEVDEEGSEVVLVKKVMDMRSVARQALEGTGDQHDH